MTEIGEIILLGFLVFALPGWQVYKGRSLKLRLEKEGNLNRQKLYNKSTFSLLGLTLFAITFWYFLGFGWENFKSPTGKNNFEMGWIAFAAITSAGFILWNLFLIKNQSNPKIILNKFGKILNFLPQSMREFQLYILLSITAGITEEILFRGILIFLLSKWLGVYLAAALALIPFGLSHTYQGKKGILRTGLIGLFLTLIYLISGSLIPAMIFHAGLNIGTGLLTFGLAGTSNQKNAKV